MTSTAESAQAQFALAVAAEGRGDTTSARASLERAVALQPTLAAAWQRLGILRGESGDANGSLEAFAHAVAIEPTNARAFNNLGTALQSLGRSDDACAAFSRAVALKADYPLALANLAVALRECGRTADAEQHARAALARNPSATLERMLVVLLAGLLRERGALDEAVVFYERAIAMPSGERAIVWFGLARTYAELDELDKARAAWKRSHELDPRDPRGVIHAALALPMIHADAAAVDAARNGYAERLDALDREIQHLFDGLAAEQVLDGLRWSNFFLAYQGGDDRGLQEKYASMVARALRNRAPEWLQRSDSSRGRHERRLRVGFASAFFRDGTAGRYFRSWVADLPRERFEVFVYHLNPIIDALTREIQARADSFTQFGGTRARPSIVAPAIRADDLDILVYPELGMDHVSFALAALRLAPVQLAGWGHPVTTGHATIDGFISCAAMEPEDAEAHYTERLYTLPGIGTHYRSLTIPERGSRAKFALPDDAVLLLCPQSHFKVHPDNDELFAEVLAANPAARLVYFEGRHPRLTETFVRRVRRVLDAHGVAPERLAVVPQVSHDDYLRVNLLCDAMLDTLHWSGGNTSLDALACGLPVVTLPGAFMRGRQSAAMLEIAGVPELVAKDRDEYIAIASRLVRDAAWRASLSARLLEGRRLLFDTAEPIAAFADLLERI